MKIYITFLLLIFYTNQAFAQFNDSIKNRNLEINSLKPKVDHAEPLYIDLMRDLGARKGEAEINLGFGINTQENYKQYYGFIEYEWAIADRLGMEIEIPFSFNSKNPKKDGSFTIPNNKVEGLKLATQYTFLVNEKRKMSLGVAYVHEFEFNNFKQIGHQGSVLTGMKMNPVFIAAKNYSQINTTLYTGPIVEHQYKSGEVEFGATINASVMYVLPHSKNFIGLENNMDLDKDGLHYTLRPQLKLAIQHNLMIGLVTGIPITKNNETNLDIMTRIIWEP